MNTELLLAARTGNWGDVNRTVLHERTEQRNTCLHIAALCGQEDFCREVVMLQPSLLSDTNLDNETPLLTAVKSNHDSSLVRGLLQKYRENNLNDALLQQDRQGCNVLHHAIRRGLSELALNLIRNSPAALSHAVNHKGESPIFMAVLRRGFKDVYVQLLNTLHGTDDESMFSGANESNALHAAIKYDEEAFVMQLVRTENPDLVRRLARKHDKDHDTPMQLAAHFNRFRILETMLHFDQSLGYHVSSEGVPLLSSAAKRGHVEFARKLLEYCPDAPYVVHAEAKTCLHEAVLNDRVKFVEFIIKEPKLGKLINMQDNDGNTALHLAVQKCNTKMVSALLDHPHTDISVIDIHNCAAIWKLNELENVVKTTNWTKISNLISDADDRAKIDIHNLHKEIRIKVESSSRKDVKSLTETYTGSTSLVAILIATVTFAAAFTLPGGYSSSAGSEGLAIMARKLAFQAFLIFDALAMCCSLAVAFLCIKIRSTDFEFLVYYRSYTKNLMWFAYMATALAFATGLYTVVAPRLLWLAITICVLSVLLPIMMVLMGEWPVLQIKFRRGKSLDSKFLDMV